MPTTATALDTLVTIPKELDHTDWTLQINHTDIQVYARKGASESGVIGFKTVTYHVVGAPTLFEFLRDVCSAMEQINDQYVGGET